MRFAYLVFFALLALVASGCGLHAYARGAASYTSSPARAEASGALALKPLVCIDPETGVAVRLSESCTLVGSYEARHGRGAAPGGMAALSSDGQCALPTAEGPLPVRVMTSTFERNLDAIDLTVGGRTQDDRYVTYRFTGVIGDNEEGDKCEALSNASSKQTD
jgi:hypothetical protein